MIVIDTHAWLWWVDDPRRLSADAREAIESADRIGVSAVSCWEIGFLSERRRVSLDRTTEQWILTALAQEHVEAVPLTPQIALAAALLEREGFPRDPADRMIYATARGNRAPLVTKDRGIRAFDPRGTIW